MIRSASRRVRRRRTPAVLALAAVVLSLGVVALLLFWSGTLPAVEVSGEPADTSPGSPPSLDSTASDSGSGTDAGELPDGATAFDDYPGITRLSPALLDALRAATQAAADDGVSVHVNSGWRSPGYQEQLLRDAVAQYGSEDEAARWVAAPETSSHVSGDAVDVGSYDAVEWLGSHGAAHGLCQTYENEPWHFELRPAAIVDGCPSPFRDPTQDPRLQR